MRRSSLQCSSSSSPRISAIFRAGSIVCGGYGMFRFAHGRSAPRILTELDQKKHCPCLVWLLLGRESSVCETHMLVTVLLTVLQQDFPGATR